MYKRQTYEQQKVVTKPFIFEGSQLKLNFETSAIGGIYIKVLDENYNEIDGLYTCEIYGNKVDRIIDFENGDISKVAGKSVRL